MFDWSLRRWVATGILVATATFLLSLGGAYLFRGALVRAIVGHSGLAVEQLANGVEFSQVPSSQIPQTPSSRASAAPVTLLPSHWESSSPATVAGALDTATVSSGQRAAIASTVHVFLPRWNTFAAAGWPRYKRWQADLKPYVSPSAVDVLDRGEAFDIPQICPHPPCNVGLRWFGWYPAPGVFTLRSDDGTNAYVTAYGLVRLQEPGTTVNGKLTAYEFALLLVREQGRWRVVRAISEPFIA